MEITTPGASKEFVMKVKELLEAITGQPYAIAQKIQLDETSIWGVCLDEDKFSMDERLSLNEGAYWVTEDNEGAIFVHSWYFYNVDDVASDEYRLNFRIYDDLLQRENWEKYRKEVPGLIAELEAAERIANEMNKKYGTNIKLLARQKPFLETCFNAKGMSEDEKLREIEKHARAMYETWRTWSDWATNVGREIYAKTTKKVLRWDEYVKEVMYNLRDFVGAKFVAKKMAGTMLAAEWDKRERENISANRGVWLFKETENKIVMMSDNLDTIDAKSIEEYRLIKLRSGRKRKRIANQGAEDVKTIINPELVEQVVRHVEEKFNIKMQLMKDRHVLVASFRKNNLRPYGKLYEIEKHAKALVEAWSRIKEKVQSLETN
jgi:hypothetical protein